MVQKAKPKRVQLFILLAMAALLYLITSMSQNTIDESNPVISNIHAPPKLRAVVLILTHPHNQYRRQLQRETWIKDLGKDIIPIYLCANVDKLTWGSENERNSFVEEFNTFGDMVVFQNLAEGYREISKKVIAGINYTMTGLITLDTNEPVLPDYVLKTDDDMYLAVENIEQLLNNSPQKEFYLGHLKMGQYAERYELSKYYTSYEQWPTDDEYPPFAGGGLYILSQDLALKVAKKSKDFKYFPFEDVQMGILMHELEVLPYHGNVAIASENPSEDTLAIHCGDRMNEYHEMFGKEWREN